MCDESWSTLFYNIGMSKSLKSTVIYCNCLFLYYRYYEFEAVTTGNMRVGFAKANSLTPGEELGSSPAAYVFDGMLVSYKEKNILTDMKTDS